MCDAERNFRKGIGFSGITMSPAVYPFGGCRVLSANLVYVKCVPNCRKLRDIVEIYCMIRFC